MLYATKRTVPWASEKYEISNPIFLCTISSIYICKYIRMNIPNMFEIRVLKQLNLSAILDFLTFQLRLRSKIVCIGIIFKVKIFTSVSQNPNLVYFQRSLTYTRDRNILSPVYEVKCLCCRGW